MNCKIFQFLIILTITLIVVSRENGNDVSFHNIKKLRVITSTKTQRRNVDEENEMKELLDAHRTIINFTKHDNVDESFYFIHLKDFQKIQQYYLRQSKQLSVQPFPVCLIIHLTLDALVDAQLRHVYRMLSMIQLYKGIYDTYPTTNHTNQFIKTAIEMAGECRSSFIDKHNECQLMGKQKNIYYNSLELIRKLLTQSYEFHWKLAPHHLSYTQLLFEFQTNHYVYAIRILFCSERRFVHEFSLSQNRLIIHYKIIRKTTKCTSFITTLSTELFLSSSKRREKISVAIIHRFFSAKLKQDITISASYGKKNNCYETISQSKFIKVLPHLKIPQLFGILRNKEKNICRGETEFKYWQNKFSQSPQCETYLNLKTISKNYQYFFHFFPENSSNNSSLPLLTSNQSYDNRNPIVILSPNSSDSETTTEFSFNKILDNKQKKEMIVTNLRHNKDETGKIYNIYKILFGAYDRKMDLNENVVINVDGIKPVIVADILVIICCFINILIQLYFVGCKYWKEPRIFHLFFTAIFHSIKITLTVTIFQKKTCKTLCIIFYWVNLSCYGWLFSHCSYCLGNLILRINILNYLCGQFNLLKKKKSKYIIESFYPKSLSPSNLNSHRNVIHRDSNETIPSSSTQFFPAQHSQSSMDNGINCFCMKKQKMKLNEKYVEFKNLQDLISEYCRLCQTSKWKRPILICCHLMGWIYPIISLLIMTMKFPNCLFNRTYCWLFDKCYWIYLIPCGACLPLHFIVLISNTFLRSKLLSQLYTLSKLNEQFQKLLREEDEELEKRYNVIAKYNCKNNKQNTSYELDNDTYFTSSKDYWLWKKDKKFSSKFDGNSLENEKLLNLNEKKSSKKHSFEEKSFQQSFREVLVVMNGVKKKIHEKNVKYRRANLNNRISRYLMSVADRSEETLIATTAPFLFIQPLCWVVGQFILNREGSINFLMIWLYFGFALLLCLFITIFYTLTNEELKRNIMNDICGKCYDNQIRKYRQEKLSTINSSNDALSNENYIKRLILHEKLLKYVENEKETLGNYETKSFVSETNEQLGNGKLSSIQQTKKNNETNSVPSVSSISMSSSLSPSNASSPFEISIHKPVLDKPPTIPKNQRPTESYSSSIPRKKYIPTNSTIDTLPKRNSSQRIISNTNIQYQENPSKNRRHLNSENSYYHQMFNYNTQQKYAYEKMLTNDDRKYSENEIPEVWPTSIQFNSTYSMNNSIPDNEDNERRKNLYSDGQIFTKSDETDNANSFSSFSNTSVSSASSYILEPLENIFRRSEKCSNVKDYGHLSDASVDENYSMYKLGRTTELATIAEEKNINMNYLSNEQENQKFHSLTMAMNRGDVMSNQMQYPFSNNQLEASSLNFSGRSTCMIEGSDEQDIFNSNIDIYVEEASNDETKTMTPELYTSNMDNYGKIKNSTRNSLIVRNRLHDQIGSSTISSGGEGESNAFVIRASTSTSSDYRSSFNEGLENK
ncbi:hypothetical protein SNEBB_009969 [Seison nebaliae]|nr:hypothetical protein SNEBB_009969 [Seison nebaliae]